MTTISYERARPSEAVVEQAKRFAEDVARQKAAAGLRQLSRSTALSDGTVIYVADMDYMQSVHIVPPYDQSSLEFETADELEDVVRTDVEAAERVRIAGVLSGAMTARFIERRVITAQGQPIEFDFLKDDEFELMPSEQMPHVAASHKLAVPENERIVPPEDSLLPAAQYRRVYPTNYTGAMAALVQVLLGVGRPIQPDQEDYWVQDSGAEFLEAPEAARSQFFNAQGYLQVDYDWRWGRTHGVIWGQDGLAYLVQLGNDGIAVTRLHTDAFSRTPEAYQRYLDVYPWMAQHTIYPEGPTFLEAFGGFPSGLGMPSGAVRDRLARAGLVYYNAGALSEFYEGNAFSTDWGWAFADQQPTAINTCWKMVEGRKYGYAYKVALNVSAAAPYTNPLSEQLIEKFNLTDAIDVYKAGKLPELVSHQLIMLGTYEDFDAAEALPAFHVQAHVVKLREGCIDYTGGLQCPNPPAQCEPTYAPHFKYYEPLLNSVVTFDFTAQDDYDPAPEPVSADGPLHACYVDSQVNILHFYYDLRAQSATKVVENTRQECQFVGRWAVNDYTESTRERGFFYCDAYDWREMHYELVGTKLTYTGHVVGTADFLAMCDVFGQGLWQVRHVFGYESYEGKRWGGSAYGLAVHCASNDRQMFFTCEETIEYQVQDIDGASGLINLGDTGYMAYGYVADFLWHWRPCGPPFVGCGDPPYCQYRECGLTYTDSCLQSYGRPQEIVYRTCPQGDGTYSVVTPCPNNAIPFGGCYYSPVPVLPPARVTETPQVTRYKCKLRAFGHTLAHNHVYREFEFEVPSAQPLTGIASRNWFRCAIPGACFVPQWRTLRNCLGTLYAAFPEEYTQGWVERGNTPPVTGRMFFGAVDDQLG